MTVVGLVGLALALGAAAGLVLRAVDRSREAVYRSRCVAHLLTINLALQLYHGQHGAFPPAVVTDAQGRPMHSWRVLILPHLGDRATYAAYNFAQPWDGPDNRPLGAAAPRAFVCPTHRGGAARTPHTSVVGVTGPGTAWGERVGVWRPADTLPLLVETTADVPWTAPVDLPAVALGAAPGRPTPSRPYPASAHGRGFHVSYPSGRTQWYDTSFGARPRPPGAP
jgi:hypothetical protein